MVAAVDSFGSGNTQEECTGRPDPSRFPQTVPASDKQWYGLSNMNDGTGDLSNGPRGSHSLIYSHETFGVDLSWAGGPALWKIEAQGGPHVMYGQAVALRVWGGGWLAYGNETFGVDVALSTPGSISGTSSARLRATRSTAGSSRSGIAPGTAISRRDTRPGE